MTTAWFGAGLFPFGWAQYLAGGLLIGSGVALLFVLTGLIGGMSSVYSSTWSYLVPHPFFQQRPLVASRGWRLAYALGLVLGALLWFLWSGQSTRVAVSIPTWQLFVGGLLVGYGARLSQGCTSGHGICGLASLSRPSLVAVLTFMATAFLTANVVARLGGA
ncbi:MAG: YeeE/YedE family protein [Gemmatimonas sp.]|jgi:uncharacterized membrane protein YedE/YeeE|uniref:YeeE/YedE family protein n=2 Tax=Gemmatimonas sp. TaxID=1962908 RepID=UPI0022C942C0|nr:YeeE/YedE thiosulfate transporter family protein [Gemmatimonas sp.]MCA2984313.1 YeeE/YedE family protein [Gemmatimonas sp.]MCA2995062.1 YeeE/YedE family protein [Gemmatimonas sp.]MCE2954916.1 YeeE/YedE family protein [Gemmatimonas sp.]MCZ8011055.1 YeeE/YedE thiosulfate transporter family protein [Gemmatimonas sp.]MCZ8266124.1 YeeE/YedE thiosulfate transporter family protein [Gemmatimonas sp.]